MCGIAGEIGFKPEKTIDAMLRTIEHRGYDDHGIFISDRMSDERRVALGHRRLSIIDTSAAGHQPFVSSDGRFRIVYNGELYNFRQLRGELESSGRVFRTESDTEVLVEAFAASGIDCLATLNGMFAFAVWDDREKRLTLVRDRAGIKPLYYAESGGRLVFASEIKAILASGIVWPELDPEALNQFLTFLWPVPPFTLFKGIRQLLPGHFLQFDASGMRVAQWWDLDFSREENGKPESFWIDETYDALDRAVEMEMISDVPIGAFLSGGVDSSAIVALMSRRSSRVSTYTTGISAEDLAFDIVPDDVRWSREVASLFDVDYHETMLSPDLTDLLPKLVRHMDAPVIDMAIPSFVISSQAREANKVMLSGMGGDEIFGGYPRQMAMSLARVVDPIPTAVRRPLMQTLESALYGGLKGPLTAPVRNLKKFARSAAMPFEDRYLGFGTYFTDAMKREVYTSDAAAMTSGFDAYSIHRAHFDKTRGWSPLNRLLYLDFKTFMPALNLDTTDRTSMAANLEVRVPFLNHEVLTLSERLPARLKIKGLKRKYVLKKACERILPRKLIWRRKAGFGAPVRSWLRSSLRPMVDDLLSVETIGRRGLFDPLAIRRMIDLNQSGKEDYNLQIFQLLNLEIWFREFIDR